MMRMRSVASFSLEKNGERARILHGSGCRDLLGPLSAGEGVLRVTRSDGAAIK
jgi:hypothetical protein